MLTQIAQHCEHFSLSLKKTEDTKLHTDATVMHSGVVGYKFLLF